MARWTRILFLPIALTGACARTAPSEPVAVAPATVDRPAVSLPAVPAPVVPPATVDRAGDPAALYAACRDRVEGPEQDGECTTDDDCAAAGCSGEVCLAAARAEGLTTTCEVLPCFAVLDACGCHEGRCTWTLGERGGPDPVPRPKREGAR